jgi:hypothetical protein
MKKLLVVLFTFSLGLGVNAQITTPAPSPFSTLEQKVGLTDVVVEYSRPSMRGRTIFGDLVPYDEIWRTGANMNTTVSFSDDVTIGGQTLKAGKYALYTKPGQSSWEVYFYSDSNNGGTPENWEDSKVAAKATAEVFNMPVNVETFTITIDDLHNNGATLGMLWANAYVGVPFGVPTVDKAVQSIEDTMSGPDANDYFAAATYYQQEGKDLKMAKEWIDKAASMNDAFWILRRKSLIYAELGDKKGAIEAARKSLASAEAEGNQDYVKLNKDSLKEWGAL